jgi:hypothetical protein
MARLLCAVGAVLFLLTASPQNSTFLEYKAVEAYEVHPGILMFPRYAEDGRVCEVGLERLHYSPEKIVLYSTLYRQDIDSIVDELAPASERGARSGRPPDGLFSMTGLGMTAIEQYEHVTVQIHSALPGLSEKSNIDTIAAVITWRDRLCK